MIVRRLILGCLGVLIASGALGNEDLELPEVKRFSALRESEAAFVSAISAHRRSDLESAIRHYEVAIERDPSFVEAMANLSRVHIERDELTRAGHWLDSAEAIRADYPDLSMVRGLLALRSGRISEAVDHLSRARAIRPHNVEILTNLAAGLLSQGRDHQSIEILLEARRLAPGRADTVFNLALAYDRGRDWPRAAHYYAQFLKLESKLELDRYLVEERLAELQAARDGVEVDASTAQPLKMTERNGEASLAENKGEEQ